MDIGTIMLLALIFSFLYGFPFVAAFIAFRRGHKGWAIATIVTAFVGLGWIVGIFALIFVLKKPKLSETEKEQQTAVFFAVVGVLAVIVFTFVGLLLLWLLWRNLFEWGHLADFKSILSNYGPLDLISDPYFLGDLLMLGVAIVLLRVTLWPIMKSAVKWLRSKRDGKETTKEAQAGADTTHASEGQTVKNDNASP